MAIPGWKNIDQPPYISTYFYNYSKQSCYLTNRPWQTCSTQCWRQSLFWGLKLRTFLLVTNKSSAVLCTVSCCSRHRSSSVVGHETQPSTVYCIVQPRVFHWKPTEVTPEFSVIELRVALPSAHCSRNAPMSFLNRKLLIYCKYLKLYQIVCWISEAFSLGVWSAQMLNHI